MRASTIAYKILWLDTEQVGLALGAMKGPLEHSKPPTAGDRGERQSGIVERTGNAAVARLRDELPSASFFVAEICRQDGTAFLTALREHQGPPLLLGLAGWGSSVADGRYD